jgi:hypothetical protein
MPVLLMRMSDVWLNGTLEEAQFIDHNGHLSPS